MSVCIVVICSIDGQYFTITYFTVSIIIQYQVDEEQNTIVKAADTLAAYIKANDELRFSNQEFSHVKERLDHVLEDYCARMPEVKYFMEHFVRLCWATVDQLAGVDQSHQA